MTGGVKGWNGSSGEERTTRTAGFAEHRQTGRGGPLRWGSRRRGGPTIAMARARDGIPGCGCIRKPPSLIAQPPHALGGDLSDTLNPTLCRRLRLRSLPSKKVLPTGPPGRTPRGTRFRARANPGSDARFPAATNGFRRRQGTYASGSTMQGRIVRAQEAGVLPPARYEMSWEGGRRRAAGGRERNLPRPSAGRQTDAHQTPPATEERMLNEDRPSARSRKRSLALVASR